MSAAPATPSTDGHPVRPPTTDVPLVPYETASAPEEGRFHNYVGHQIPWAVRLLWVLFWSASAWYVIKWLLPALQTELISPP